MMATAVAPVPVPPDAAPEAPRRRLLPTDYEPYATLEADLERLAAAPRAARPPRPEKIPMVDRTRPGIKAGGAHYMLFENEDGLVVAATFLEKPFGASWNPPPVRVMDRYDLPDGAILYVPQDLRADRRARQLAAWPEAVATPSDAPTQTDLPWRIWRP